MLGLSYNQLGDVGARLAGDCLLKNMILEGLYLAKNGIDVEGALVLADALEDNRTLRFLDLRSNKIPDLGTFAVCAWRDRGLARSH